MNNSSNQERHSLHRKDWRSFLFLVLSVSALAISCNKDDSKTVTPTTPERVIDTPIASWANTVSVIRAQRTDLIGRSDSINAQPNNTYTKYIYEVISGRSVSPNGTAAKFLAGEMPYTWVLDTNNLSAGIHVSSRPVGGTAQFDGKFPAYYSYSQHTEVKIVVDDTVQGGTYDYVLRGTNAKTSDSLTLYVHGRIKVPMVNNDCVTDRLGNYTGTASCAQNGSGSGSGVVTAVTGIANRIQFADNNGLSIYADLNCVAKTLNIPTQSIGGGIDATGSGTFNANTMTLTLRYSGAGVDTCVYTLQK